MKSNVLGLFCIPLNKANPTENDMLTAAHDALTTILSGTDCSPSEEQVIRQALSQVRMAQRAINKDSGREHQIELLRNKVLDLIKEIEAFTKE